MKNYKVTFECQLPIRILTTIIAQDTEELIKKIENNEIKDFQFQTTDTFKELKNINIKEIK